MAAPNYEKRRPPQDPLDGKGPNRYSDKVRSATDSMESNDVQNFDRGGYPGEPHREVEPPIVDNIDPVKVISNFSRLGDSLKNTAEFRKMAVEIAKIAEMAESTVMQEAGDWFDGHTIKRNMKELKGHAGAFNKIAEELDNLHQRATALYDDMGNVLARYFEMSPGMDSEGEPFDGKKAPEFDGPGGNPADDAGRKKHDAQDGVIGDTAPPATGDTHTTDIHPGDDSDEGDDDIDEAFGQKPIQTTIFSAATFKRIVKDFQFETGIKNPRDDMEAFKKFVASKGYKVLDEGDDDILGEAGPVGEVQKKLLQALHGGGDHQLSVLARDPEFRRVHFGLIQRAASALQKKKLISYDGTSKVSLIEKGVNEIADEELEAITDAVMERILPERGEDTPEAARKTLRTPKAFARSHQHMTHDQAKDILRKTGAKTVSEAHKVMEAASSVQMKKRESTIREIAKQNQAVKIDEVLVDPFTASGMVKLLDNLSPKNKVRFLSQPIDVMADIMWKVLKKK